MLNTLLNKIRIENIKQPIVSRAFVLYEHYEIQHAARHPMVIKDTKKWDTIHKIYLKLIMLVKRHLNWTRRLDERKNMSQFWCLLTAAAYAAAYAAAHAPVPTAFSRYFAWRFQWTLASTARGRDHRTGEEPGYYVYQKSMNQPSRYLPERCSKEEVWELFYT